MRVILFAFLASQGTGIINSGEAEIADIQSHADSALAKATTRGDKQARKNDNQTRAIPVLIEANTAYFAVVNPTRDVPVNINWELIESGDVGPSIEKAMNNMMTIVRSFRQR